MSETPTIAVLGASGLIGSSLCTALARQGHRVLPIARSFSPAQQHLFAGKGVRSAFVDLDDAALSRLLAPAEIIVNCTGVLQDTARGTTDDVHVTFVARLIAVLEARSASPLLVHISIPGEREADTTAFASSKRAAEGLLSASSLAHVILRPGFVIALAAYGGSALLRALAALPLDLPEDLRDRPFAVTASADLARVVAHLAGCRQAGRRDWAACWDVLSARSETVGSVLDAFRAHFGGPAPWCRVPAVVMEIGARAGDLVARLGWRPPVRSTALLEMRRGVAGDPGPLVAETGLAPAPLSEALADVSPSVQETWFARLYLLKALIIAGLALFWGVSGLVTLLAAFRPAMAILTDHGVAGPLAAGVTALTSLADIAIGAAIAVRRSCRAGLVAGLVLSLGYMAGAVILTPELWLDPLGSLVKTGPAIVLMLVALAIFEDR